MLTKPQGYDSRNASCRRGQFPFQILKPDMEDSLPEKAIKTVVLKFEIFGRFWGEGGFEAEDVKSQEATSSSVNRLNTFPLLL
jgi:hypothetical protein